MIATLEATADGKKRTHDSSDPSGRSAKVRKLNENSTISGESQDENGLSQTDQSNETETMKEPLQSCLQNLFRTFVMFTVTDELSPKTYFIYQFLLLLQQCGGTQRIKPVLKLLPQGLVQNLLKMINTNDSMHDFILR